MTSNGSRTSTATWIGVLISAVSVTFALTFTLARSGETSRMTRFESDIHEIKEWMKSVDSKIDVRVDGIAKELSSRFDSANKEHKSYEIRLERIETKVGIPR